MCSSTLGGHSYVPSSIGFAASVLPKYQSLLTSSSCIGGVNSVNQNLATLVSMIPHSTDSWSSLRTMFPSSSTSIQSMVLLLILSSALHIWRTALHWISLHIWWTASHWISSWRSHFAYFCVFESLSKEWSLAWSRRCSLQSFGAFSFNFSYSLIATFFNQIAWASVQLRGHSTLHH